MPFSLFTTKSLMPSAGLSPPLYSLLWEGFSQWQNVQYSKYTTGREPRGDTSQCKAFPSELTSKTGRESRRSVYHHLHGSTQQDPRRRNRAQQSAPASPFMRTAIKSICLCVMWKKKKACCFYFSPASPNSHDPPPKKLQAVQVSREATRFQKHTV